MHIHVHICTTHLIFSCTCTCSLDWLIDTIIVKMDPQTSSYWCSWRGHLWRHQDTPADSCDCGGSSGTHLPPLSPGNRPQPGTQRQGLAVVVSAAPSESGHRRYNIQYICTVHVCIYMYVHVVHTYVHVNVVHTHTCTCTCSNLTSKKVHVHVLEIIVALRYMYTHHFWIHT